MERRAEREEFSFDLGKKRSEGDRKAVDAIIARLREGGTNIRVSLDGNVMRISYIKGALRDK